MTTTRGWIVYWSAVLLAVIAQESPAGLRAWPSPLIAGAAAFAIGLAVYLCLAAWSGPWRAWTPTTSWRLSSRQVVTPEMEWRTHPVEALWLSGIPLADECVDICP